MKICHILQHGIQGEGKCFLKRGDILSNEGTWLSSWVCLAGVTSWPFDVNGD